MSTEKKIVDYLHLYGIDCPIMTPDGEGSVLVIYPKVVEVSLNIIKYQQVMKGRKGGSEMHYKYNYEDCQLLLSKLEDLKGQDLLDAFHLSFEDAEYKFSEVERNEFGWRSRNQNGMECYMPNNSFTPPTFHYLLKKGYWLFGNDWFDEGLIIDRKTLK